MNAKDEALPLVSTILPRVGKPHMENPQRPAGSFPVSAERIADPTGEPQPVHASQPGPAKNAPLLPEVMS